MSEHERKVNKTGGIQLQWDASIEPENLAGDKTETFLGYLGQNPMVHIKISNTGTEPTTLSFGGDYRGIGRSNRWKLSGCRKLEPKEKERWILQASKKNKIWTELQDRAEPSTLQEANRVTSNPDLLGLIFSHLQPEFWALANLARVDKMWHAAAQPILNRYLHWKNVPDPLEFRKVNGVLWSMGGYCSDTELKPGAHTLQSIPLCQFLVLDEPGIFQITLWHDMGISSSVPVCVRCGKKGHPMCTTINLHLQVPSVEKAKEIFNQAMKGDSPSHTMGQKRPHFYDAIELTHPVYMPLILNAFTQHAKGTITMDQNILNRFFECLKKKLTRETTEIMLNISTQRTANEKGGEKPTMLADCAIEALLERIPPHSPEPWQLALYKRSRFTLDAIVSCWDFACFDPKVEALALDLLHLDLPLRHKEWSIKMINKLHQPKHLEVIVKRGLGPYVTLIATEPSHYFYDTEKAEQNFLCYMKPLVLALHEDDHFKYNNSENKRLTTLTSTNATSKYSDAQKFVDSCFRRFAEDKGFPAVTRATKAEQLGELALVLFLLEDYPDVPGEPIPEEEVVQTLWDILKVNKSVTLISCLAIRCAKHLALFRHHVAEVLPLVPQCMLSNTDFIYQVCQFIRERKITSLRDFQLTTIASSTNEHIVRPLADSFLCVFADPENKVITEADWELMLALLESMGKATSYGPVLQCFSFFGDILFEQSTGGSSSGHAINWSDRNNILKLKTMWKNWIQKMQNSETQPVPKIQFKEGCMPEDLWPGKTFSYNVEGELFQWPDPDRSYKDWPKRI